MLRDERGLAGLPWAALGLLAAVKIGLTMAVADRYGWQRDEFYYLASSKHLAFGYVDYPPVTPLIARLDQAIFPGSLPGFRLPNVLAGAGLIIVAALIARELGGSRAAQILAGLAALISGMFLGANLLFQTVSFDQLIWASACLLFVRLLDGANPREWLLLGLVFGIGLETKYTIMGLGVAMIIALLVTKQRRMLASPWPWLGLAIAVVLLAPNIAWQISHNWDSVAYTVNHRGATDGPVFYWLQQLVLANIFLLPIMVAGVVWMWRRPQWRPAAITVVAVELVFFLAGGKAYYPAPIFTLTYAAGSIWLVDEVRRRWVRRLIVAAAIAFTLVLLPIAVPILPAKTAVDLGLWKPRKDYADMFGWPELTQQVTAVYQQVPISERNSLLILASNYGEAGAIQYYGRGLPPLVCSHLTYYYWARSQMSPSTLIVVGYSHDYLASILGGDIQEAGTISNSYGIHNEEYGKSIWIIRNPRVPLSRVWPQLKSLD